MVHKITGNKLRKIGLVITWSPVIIYVFIYLGTGLFIEEPSVLYMLLAGIARGIPAIIVAIAVWKWPRQGGITGIIVSSLIITVSIVVSILDETHATGIFRNFIFDIYPNLFYLLTLIGSIIVLIASRRINLQ